MSDKNETEVSQQTYTQLCCLLVCCLFACYFNFIIVVIPSTGTRIRHRSKRDLTSKFKVSYNRCMEKMRQQKVDLILITIEAITGAIKI